VHRLRSLKHGMVTAAHPLEAFPHAYLAGEKGITGEGFEHLSNFCFSHDRSPFIWRSFVMSGPAAYFAR
jgi:hypothetical protein